MLKENQYGWDKRNRLDNKSHQDALRHRDATCRVSTLMVLEGKQSVPRLKLVQHLGIIRKLSA